jgi:cell pole-organizing protein PopZ
MEEILASIRRIIADEPKVSHEDALRIDPSYRREPRQQSLQRESFQPGQPQSDVSQNGARDLDREGPSPFAHGEVDRSRVEPLRADAPRSYEANAAVTHAAPQSPGTWLPDRGERLALEQAATPQDRPLAPPEPDLRSVQEEIDAILGKLNSANFQPAALAPGQSPEPIEIADGAASALHLEHEPADNPAEEGWEEETHAEAHAENERALAPMAAQPHAEMRNPRFLTSGARAEEALISVATSAAVDSAFNTLAQTVLVQNGRTLEDLVREMLRPMLKIWLDDNLPGLVERLVRSEIERVSRGR